MGYIVVPHLYFSEIFNFIKKVTIVFNLQTMAYIIHHYM